MRRPPPASVSRIRNLCPLRPAVPGAPGRQLAASAAPGIAAAREARPVRHHLRRERLASGPILVAVDHVALPAEIPVAEDERDLEAVRGADVASEVDAEQARAPRPSRSGRRTRSAASSRSRRRGRPRRSPSTSRCARPPSPGTARARGRCGSTPEPAPHVERVHEHEELVLVAVGARDHRHAVPAVGPRQKRRADRPPAARRRRRRPAASRTCPRRSRA